MQKKLVTVALMIILVLIFTACAAVSQAPPSEAYDYAGTSVDAPEYEGAQHEAHEYEETPVEASDYMGTSTEVPEYEGNSEIIIQTIDSQQVYILPPYIIDGDMSVEQALASRRSRRNFQDKPISASQLSQILWAAYGITLPIPDSPALRGGLRTTPSAGALFPLEIYVIIGRVEGIEPGVFRYIPDGHKLIRIAYGDIRDELAEAALSQRMVREAPVSVFYSGVFSRMTGRYGDRGIRYTYIELGHSAQNVYLQAEALGLGTVAIGAFFDYRVREILELPADEEPLYIMPVGYFYGD